MSAQETTREAGRSQTERFLVRRYTARGTERIRDEVATEEPLSIRLSYRYKGARKVDSAAVTMRTPGHEAELALGFLLAEGIIAGREDVADVRILGSVPDRNEVLVELADCVDADAWQLRRATLLNSACGLCGKKALDAAEHAPPAEDNDFRVPVALIYQLSALLRTRQAGFVASGGLHAAAALKADGAMTALFEDIGRHNALDKLIGHHLIGGSIPMRDSLVVMSSRGSFELVQKALAAGCPMLATIGAPSSLAISFARERGLTLIGFVREERFNVYSGEWRVAS